MKKSYRTFIEHFEPELKVYSPGRINFIGEHTDYNQGFVLPTAIDKKITFSFKRNNSPNVCNVLSTNYNAFLEFDLNQVFPSKISWENYILGVVFEIQKISDKLKGFDCLIESELPEGSGISSSAALECGLASGLNELFDLGITKEELVFLSQKAEHLFVGTKCGIMDQYASIMSRADQVILLDCKTQQHRYINASFDPYEIVLLNTNVTHSLADSEYNTRRKECETVVDHVRNHHPDVDSLRDVTISLLNESRDDISQVLYERASYVIEENDRVLNAAGALEEGSLVRFGELMYASHEGLRHKYGVSCKELDFLVDFSKDYPEVVGSRMMGGGFGGCTINLIHKDKVDSYIKKVSPVYKKTFGIALSAFVTKASEGTLIERL